jgi:hypothetical protein
VTTRIVDGYGASVVRTNDGRNASSPPVVTRECALRICSVSVEPERNIPQMNNGRVDCGSGAATG